MCCAIPLQGFAFEPSEKLLFEKNALYQYISVVEDTVKKERYVRNQKREYTQGGIYVNAPVKLLFEFMQMGFVSLPFLDMVITYKKAFPNLVIFKGKKSAKFIFVATSGSKIKDKDSVEARARKIQCIQDKKESL